MDWEEGSEVQLSMETSIVEYGDSLLREYESLNQGWVSDGREEEADWVRIKKESPGMHRLSEETNL